MKQLWSVTLIGAMALIVARLFWAPAWSTPPREHLPWKTGFWIWAGDTPAEAKTKPDLLYVQVPGTQWPEGIPAASHYVMVRRLEHGHELTPQLAKALAEVYRRVLRNAPQTVLGLQIDYDCPTSRLPDYAAFLTNLNEALPPDTLLSITALLDWFRPDTRIQEVVDAVDEYVPQFYDAGSERAASGIAAPIDVERWAPVFNRLGVPYRIGVSSFGRVARRRLTAEGTERVMYFRDARPLDFALRKDLVSASTMTDAGETVVHYAIGDTHAGLHSELAAGDSVAITFPTARSVSNAYDSVRRFGGYCAGAIFFRWPNRSEDLAFTADEVDEILSGAIRGANVQVETRDGECVSLRCSDVYLRLGVDPAPAPRTILVRSAGTVDMFLPEGPLKSNWRPTRDIVVNVPAYSGLRSIYLGRALSHDSVHFEVANP